MRNKFLLFILLLSMAGAASATDLDIQLSNHTAQIGISQAITGQAPDVSKAGAAIFYNQDDDIIGTASFHILGNLRSGFEPLRFGAGVKAYVAHLDAADTTTAALAVGGLIRMDIPQTIVPLAIVAEGHIAPSITSTGQGDGLLDLSGRIEARIARHATVYAGYRYLRFDLDHGPHHVASSNFLVGLRLGF